jgi:hypothetical protein
MIRSLVFASLALLGLPVVAATAQSSAAARATMYRARILGVYDDLTGDPIDSVRVTDILNGNSSLTTRTGTVSLYFLPDGGSMVRLQKIGYEAQTLTIAISPADTTPLTLTLRRLTQLSPVVTKAKSRYISPALQGFEERKKTGFGYFVDDSVLRANEGRLLANVIASRMPNMFTAQGRASSVYLMRSGRCVNGGPPQVYLDGVPLAPDLPMGFKAGHSVDNLPFNLSNFDVNTLAGVEWYPDNVSVPMEFSHTSARCGSLLLWTRER